MIPTRPFELLGIIYDIGDVSSLCVSYSRFHKFVWRDMGNKYPRVYVR